VWSARRSSKAAAHAMGVELTDNLYLNHGQRGNCAAIAHQQGSMLVDDNSRKTHRKSWRR